MNEYSIKVGIIIPAYNVQDYIKRGIESCIHQTYTKIEIIIVDDGSNDNTPNIAKNYSQMDDRISVYTQSNNGVSSARNYGLRMCSSDYVLFLDSDDWLELDTVEKLILNLPKDNNSYLVSVGASYKYLCDGNILKEENPISSNSTNISAEEALMYISSPEYKLSSSCYKLYSMDIIRKKNLYFNEALYHGEDGLFVFEYLKSVNRFIYKPYLLWNILTRPGSATTGGYNEKMLTAIDAVDSMLSYKNSDELNQVIYNYKISRTIGVLVKAMLDMNNNLEDIKYLRYILRNERSKYMKTEKNIYNKIKYLVAAHMPIKVLYFIIKVMMR